jgi:tRNA (guanine26-N2/guanine27-N2)-dimethyltransferase
MESRAGPERTVDPTKTAEGKARLIVSGGPDTPKAFYNPKMSLNRDIAILFLQSYFPASRHLRVCDPMTGTGVRAVRYLLESPNVLSVLAADKDSETVEAARATVHFNGLEERISVFESDANLLLLNHAKERFDLVDLDPFGSPAPFFESALRATIDDGILAATATDMAPLTGARASACIRKYGVSGVRTEFEKEVAVRVLASCLAGAAGRLGLGINIVFAHASDHYVRIYAVITKGKTPANISAKSLGFIEYCRYCLRRDSLSSLQSIRTTCEDCGNKTIIGGLIWLGALWDPSAVKRMIGHSPILMSSRLSEIQRLLTRIDEEWEAPLFYYRTDVHSARLAVKPPKISSVLDALRESGYKATRTHFDPNGFRTDAPNREVSSIVKSLANKAQA